MTTWTGLRDARHLRLVRLVTHRCRTCTAPVEVSLCEATTFHDIANRQRHWIWGHAQRCRHCGSTAYPLPVLDFNYLTWGRL